MILRRLGVVPYEEAWRLQQSVHAEVVEGADDTVQLVSVHPGVTVEEVQSATGFELALPDGGVVPTTREPSAEELTIIRDVLDPKSLRFKEVPA